VRVKGEGEKGARNVCEVTLKSEAGRGEARRVEGGGRALAEFSCDGLVVDAVGGDGRKRNTRLKTAAVAAGWTCLSSSPVSSR
jgi:hypothetical protein